jgi:hypothetical protein
MPELSRFYGIVIAMFYQDHNPPHIHVYGGNSKRPDWSIQLEIRDGSILDGEAPKLALKLVRDWLRLHREEVFDAWYLAVNGEKPFKIAPLRFR